MAGALRGRIGEARIMWIFSPATLAAGLAVLDQIVDLVDVIQVRPKPSGRPEVRTRANEARDWTRSVLERTASREGSGPLVLVNDRVDVAGLLLEEGCAGVHLGQDDMPVAEARAFLGEQALIGLSTHSSAEVGRALEAPIDYLGFGPIWPTATKAVREGLGPDRAWIAQAASDKPVFPIGGIDLCGAAELAKVGRAAVASLLTDAADPRATAKSLRALLSGEALRP